MSNSLRQVRAKVITPKWPVRPSYGIESFGTHRTQRSGFIETTYFNGLGRPVCQVQRMTFKFSKTSGSCKGFRDFIERDLIDFGRANPGIAMYLKPRFRPSPILVSEYLNGNNQWFNFRNMTREEIKEWLEFFVCRSGLPIQRYRKPHHTDWPSIQGMWTPFLNIPPQMNVAEYPVESRAQARQGKLTATEQLAKLQENLGNLHILKEHKSRADQ